jgi:hypothetical protein
MSMLETRWSDVVGMLDAQSVTALVAVLDRRGDLNAVKDRVVAQAGEDIRADVAGATKRTRATAGKLGAAVALIEAGAAKEVVLTKVSRRTFFRARQECQECQRHSEPSVTV